MIEHRYTKAVIVVRVLVRRNSLGQQNRHKYSLESLVHENSNGQYKPLVHKYAKSRNGPFTSNCVSRGARDREVARPPGLDSSTEGRWGMSHARGGSPKSSAIAHFGARKDEVALRTACRASRPTGWHNCFGPSGPTASDLVLALCGPLFLRARAVARGS